MAVGFIVAATALSSCGGSSIPFGSAPAQNVPMREGGKSKGCVAPPCIYVSNNGSAHAGGITVYDGNANGNAGPVEVIRGKKTGIINSYGVGLDSNRHIYSANFVDEYYGSSVTEYDAGANGNVAPIRTLTSAPSGKYLMWRTSDVVVDSAGKIFVTALGSDSLSVYKADASGYDKPSRYIHGGKTQMDEPVYLELAKNGDIYVANYYGNSVTIYSRNADGDAAPIRMIAGSQTKLHGCSGVALDSEGNIYVSNGGANSVTVFGKNANGNVAPIRTISGQATGLNVPDGIAVDANDNVYVTNAPSVGPSVTVYAKDANGNVAPTQTITGSKTLLDVPSGLVVQ